MTQTIIQWAPSQLLNGKPTLPADPQIVAARTRRTCTEHTTPPPRQHDSTTAPSTAGALQRLVTHHNDAVDEIHVLLHHQQVHVRHQREGEEHLACRVAVGKLGPRGAHHADDAARAAADAAVACWSALVQGSRRWCARGGTKRNASMGRRTCRARNRKGIHRICGRYCSLPRGAVRPDQAESGSTRARPRFPATGVLFGPRGSVTNKVGRIGSVFDVDSVASSPFALTTG